MPFSSGCRCSVRNASSIAAGRVSNRSSSRDVEQLVDHLEIGVERRRLGARRKQPRVQVLQQDHVDLAHELGRAVVALHQLLARALGRRVDEPDLARERVLQVEHQPVLAAAGEVVQAHAQRADAGAPAATPSRASPVVMSPARASSRHDAAEARGARDPDHRLQVAQAAGAFLDVGLEVVRGVVVLEVALLLLEHLRLVERRARPSPPRTRARNRAYSAREPATSRCSSRLVLHRDVGGHLGFAFVDRAHAVADLDADVPQQADEALDDRRARPRRAGAAAGSARRRRSAERAGRGRSRRRRPARSRPGRPARARRRRARGRRGARARAAAAPCRDARGTPPAARRGRPSARRASGRRAAAGRRGAGAAAVAWRQRASRGG